ncbi:MAG: insulinase family protein [Candidatus Tokpelaia sp.]|nr:MAG: insulinase family protein [Candidatus Tokpelaia sp.]KAA6207225.1 MAG: insulinase family protein [Candidatus Tokpelaia sp.]
MTLAASKLVISKLANGLTIATENRPFMKSIALGLWVKAGSRNEQEPAGAHASGQTRHGIAHLLEHMAFKGTKGRTAEQIAAAIEDVGGDINAATGLETTGYFIRILPKDLALAADILGDIITAPLFDKTELEREKQVILQEIGAANDTPDDVVFDQLTEIAWPGQAIGRPILGTPATVASFEPEDLRAFMREHYYGGNMVAVACGAVEHEDFAAKIAEKLGSLPIEPAVKAAALPVQYQGGDNRQSRNLMDTQLIIGFEGCSNTHADYYAAHILAMILGGGMSSRLFQEIREKRGLCYSISAFHWAFADSGLFGIHTATSGAGLAELMPVLLSELAKAAHNIDKRELERARAQYAAGLIMGQESAAARAAGIARQILFYGFVKTEEEILQKLAAVSTAQVQNLAQRLFFNSRPCFAALGCIDTLLPYKAICEAMTANAPAAASEARFLPEK